jgi:nicotinamide-nucleotide amidase
MNMNTLEHHSRQVIELCRNHGLTLATAESCTGGLIAANLTDVPGASQVFDRGFITYSNQAKTELLGVPAELIADHGAVSEQVAREMALGAVLRAHTSIAVAVTGVAGPDGGTGEKPIGLVHIACARSEHQTLHHKYLFGPLTRKEIRIKTVEAAFDLIVQQIPAADLA